MDSLCECGVEWSVVLGSIAEEEEKVDKKSKSRGPEESMKWSYSLQDGAWCWGTRGRGGVWCKQANGGGGGGEGANRARGEVGREGGGECK